MKNVLFIGVTQYDLTRDDPHLQKKFEGLSSEFNVFSIARGKPLYIQKWNANFYLAPYRFLFVPYAFAMGAYLCATKRINVIVCQTPLTEGLIGVILSFVFRKELVVEVHGDWEELPFLSRKRMLESLLKKITPRIGAFILRRADKIRTLTNLFSEKIRNIAPGKKIFIFPTYTDIDYFLEGTDLDNRRGQPVASDRSRNGRTVPASKYILTVAVLSPIKNIETLIDAFGRIQKEFPDFKLVIAGDGVSRKDLQLKAYSLGLNDSVIFTGKLSPERVREVMKDCYVFVLPSLSEGFGRVFIEAMALGKSVIGSNAGGIPEIIKDGENGFLIEPKDVDALTEKIKKLILEKNLAQSMGLNGRRFVKENFSKEKYIENFTKMIYS